MTGAAEHAISMDGQYDIMTQQMMDIRQHSKDDSSMLWSIFTYRMLCNVKSTTFAMRLFELYN